MPNRCGIQALALEDSEDALEATGNEAGEFEAALIQQAQADPLAFGKLYEAYYSRILNYVYRSTLDRTVAEELTSNTFFKAFRGLRTYVPRTPFRCWLFRIATNEIRMHWRKEKLRRFCGLAARPSFSGEADDCIMPDVEEREKQRDLMRRYARVHKRLSELPARYQVPLRLRYIEQLALEEIAGVLGKPLGTIKSLIHRGLARLRARLEHDATFRDDMNY